MKLLRRIFFLVVFLIVYGSLYPWAFAARTHHGNVFWVLLHRWDSFRNGYFIRDIFVNLVIYLPVGLTGYLAFRKTVGYWGVLLFGFCLAVGVEITQLYEPLRQSSMVDVICDTLGTAFGIAIAALARNPLLEHTGKRFADRGATLLATAWVVWLVFPLIPLRRFAEVDLNAGLFAHSPRISLLPVISALAIWYGAGLLLQGAGVRSARLWLALSLLAVSAQIFFRDQLPVTSELAGGLAGVMLFALRTRLAPETRHSAPVNVTSLEAWGFLVLAGMGGLASLHLAHQPNGFSLVPFAGFIRSDGPTGLRIILGQLFSWGAAIWMLNASGKNPGQSISLVAGVVAVTQLAAIFVDGGSPGITAPLLAVLAGYVLEAAASHQTPSELQAELQPVS